MTVTLMEPLVAGRTRTPVGAEARAPSAVTPRPVVRLTNRAARAIRAADDPRFGGFGYARTAQDTTETARAAAAELARSGRAATPEAAPAAGAAASTEAAPDTAVLEATAPGVAPAPAPTPTGRGPAAGPGSSEGIGSISPPTGVDSPAALVSAVRASASTLPHPDVPRAGLTETLRPMVSTARAGVGRGGGGRAFAARPVEPIEIDPVPQATAALSQALNARLPDLELPALTPRPDGELPVLPEVPGLAEGERAVQVPVTDPSADAAMVNRAEERRHGAASRTPAPAPEPVPPEVPVNPPVLVDVRPLPPPPLPPAQAELETAQITRVLAIIEQGVDASTEDIIGRVRSEAFPPERLEDHFESVTNPWKVEVRQLLEAKVGELRAAAGISQQALEAAVAARRAELVERRAHVAGQEELELTQAMIDRQQAAARQNADELARQRREQALLVGRLRAALHRRDPTLVEELVTRRLGYVDDDVARAVVTVDAAKARRLLLIDRYEAAYQQAYNASDSAFQHPPGRTEARAPPADAQGRLWIDTVRDALTTAMAGLRARTTTAADSLAGSIRTAGLAARAAVQAWRDTRLRRTASADDLAARNAADVAALDAKISTTRTQAAQAAVRESLLTDVRLASAAYLQIQDERNRASVARARTLDEASLARMRTYLGRGDPTDPLSAVANVLVARVTQDYTAAHATTLRDHVLAIVPTDRERADQLAIAYFPGSAGGLNGRVSKLWRAFEGAGTDEDAVIEALTGLDGPQTALLRATYALRHGESLTGRIASEMSGSDYTRATGLASNDREMYARGEIDASDGWFSNDPARALDAVRTLPPGSAARVVDDPATRAHLTTVLGGSRYVEGRGYVADERGEQELQLLVAVNEGARPTDSSGVPGSSLAPRLRDLQAAADAIELDRIIRRGGSGAPSLDALFDRIRTSVTSDPRTSMWSAQEIDDEVRRRARAMEMAYETRFGSELPSGGVSALRTAIARYQWGSTADLTTTLLDVNRAGERAVRLQRTTEGLYTADAELNTELDRTFREARAEVLRSPRYRDEIEAVAARLMAGDHVTDHGRTPSAREVEAYRREATDEVARTLARAWMADVIEAFGQRYAGRWGGNPSDALRAMVVSETQFDGEREALDRLGRRDASGRMLGGGGGLTQAQAIAHGVAGWGMDRDRVVGSLEGRTVQQIARISAEYRDTTGEDMMTRLRSETGGWNGDTPDVRLERDAFDIREAVRGVPLNPDEELAAARRRRDYERDVYFRDHPYEREAAVGQELGDLEREYDRVARRAADYHAAVAAGDTRRMRLMEHSIAAAHDSMRVAAANYRTAVDAYVDRTSQIAAIVAAVVAAVVVTVVTGGTAGPAVIALAASLAGTAAGIANKAAVLGAAYSSTALQTDLLVGAVDAVVTVLTARLGNVLLRLPRPTGATQAALRASIRSIEAQRLARPLLHRAAAFTVEQVAQSVPAAVTGAMLSRDTWRGDPLRNVLTTAGTAAAVGIGVGAAMHGASSFAPRLLGAAGETIRMLRRGTASDIAEDAVVLGSTRRGLAAGGEAARDAAGSTGGPLERFLARREYFARFPDATEWDFRLALAEGAVRSRQAASQVAALEAEMMGHLLSGVGGPGRELVARTRIIMLPDAEFAARTGSQSNGYAATLVIRGDPVVVIREGAPLSRLREEGLHVQQFFDPAHTDRLALLDEARMRRWGELGLSVRIASWQAKIDLELEVQARVIRHVEAELEQPGLHPLRALDLGDELDDARAAVEVLTRRRAVLHDLGPDDLAAARRGTADPPAFLADQPRLFNKTGSTVGTAVVDLDVPTSSIEPLTGGGFREIGQPFRHNSVLRRFIRVLAPDGTVLHTALEKRVKGQWVTSGHTGRVRGGIAELAMRIERSGSLGTSGGTTRVAFDAQRGSGSGFDDVVFTFGRNADGTVSARMDITELKDYFDNYVSSWSAVSDNFDANLALVEARLTAFKGRAEQAGMTDTQLQAALDLIAARRDIHIELRIGEYTQVGSNAVNDVAAAVNGTPGSAVTVSLRQGPIAASALQDATRYWDVAEAYRQRGAKDPDNQLFRALADTPQGMTPESIARADTAVAARRAGIIGRGARWSPSQGVMVDALGTVAVTSVDARALRSRGDFFAAAVDLLDRVEAAQARSGTGWKRVLVDSGALTPAQARELRTIIRAVAELRGRTAVLDTMLFIDSTRDLRLP